MGSDSGDKRGRRQNRRSTARSIPDRHKLDKADYWQMMAMEHEIGLTAEKMARQDATISKLDTEKRLLEIERGLQVKKLGELQSMISTQRADFDIFQKSIKQKLKLEADLAEYSLDSDTMELIFNP